MRRAHLALLRYVYNNSGYFLLGMVIEKVTGRTYEETLRAQILAPLGLTDTGYGWAGPIIPKRAAGYTGRGDAVRNAAYIDMQHPFAAGAIDSTAVDLLKWEQALYEETLLPAAAVAAVDADGRMQGEAARRDSHGAPR